jgi:hypothetical protein
VDEGAIHHNAGVTEETTEPRQAYARFPQAELIECRDGWLPE